MRTLMVLIAAALLTGCTIIELPKLAIDLIPPLNQDTKIRIAAVRDCDGFVDLFQGKPIAQLHIFDTHRIQPSRTAIDGDKTVQIYEYSGKTMYFLIKDKKIVAAKCSDRMNF